ncbi:MAG: uroporphyrinogen-III C-methyltransferase [Prevotella sp.]|jgi:uroporphyrinogen III methyltransferase/synthase|nr:uroporphyrinogen-III C-methyltransferase [Prevotella sp.]
MKTGKKLKIICRNSPLSLIQTKEALSFFPSVEYELRGIASFGDKNKHISLLDKVDADFFTRELDKCIIDGKADIAVHSAKDLPYPLPADLELYCLLEAADKTDALVSRNNLTLGELPTGSRIGTSSAARKAELLKYCPNLTVTGIRGTIEERIAQVDSGCVDALIVATCALKRLHLEKRIAEILPFKTHPLQGNLAITGKKDRPEQKALFATKDIRKNYGKVTLVGFGPGNPDLLTIGGDKALSKADVIFHDDLLDKDYLSRYAAEKVAVGKRKGRHRFCQDEINEMTYQAAIAGKNVVRLKGGDPMLFAHGREEIDFLQSRFVEVEVISGISSGIALAAYTHIPLTHRGVSSSVAFVTGHSLDNRQTPKADTLVYYMGGANIAEIANRLIVEGRQADTPAALVYNVSLPDQKVYYSTLNELQHSIVKYPTPVLIIIGEVVAFEHQQAGKQRIMVTGTQADDYTGYGEIVHSPLIKVRKIDNNERLSAQIDNIQAFDWLIFTSRYGVRYFFEAWKNTGKDIRLLSNIQIASIGKTTTAELHKFYLCPDVESYTESAEGLIAHFKKTEAVGRRILLPRSNKGLKQLSEELAKQGHLVFDIPVYINEINSAVPKTDLASVDKIVFSSPSGVDAFTQLYGEVPEGKQLITKGKTTEKRLRTVLNETI